MASQYYIRGTGQETTRSTGIEPETATLATKCGYQTLALEELGLRCGLAHGSLVIHVGVRTGTDFECPIEYGVISVEFKTCDYG